MSAPLLRALGRAMLEHAGVVTDAGNIAVSTHATGTIILSPDEAQMLADELQQIIDART